MNFLKNTTKFYGILNRKQYGLIFILTLAISIFIPLISIPSASASPWSGDGQSHPYLTPKWRGFVAGGGEALLTADVLSQYGGEEVFHAGGPVQPSSSPGRVTCMNGRTGEEIWRASIIGIGDTATIQMADIDSDGRLEIVVTLQHPGGLYVLNAEDGSILWRAPGTYNGNLGYITPIGGRIDGSGVIGDVDADGNMDIFIGVMAYEEQPQTGKLIRYEWNPAQNALVEQVRTTVWHPCAGGLSLGDTDNDGTFELYMNERDVYFGDGAWGRGLTSFWAVNLTKRWDIYEWGASSDIPMLADVNKDGIVDVVTTNLGTGVCVLNSTDGHPLTNANGTVLYNQRLGLPVHYQSSIYDIDNDGSLEILCADGQEGGYSETRIWDLYNWQLDGIIPNVVCFRGPSIGEVTGDGLMDILVVTFNKTNPSNPGSIQIYNSNLQLLDSHGGLQHRAIGSVVQDIDRDDNGLNELLVLTQGGVIYCFDTPGLSQERLGNPRPRSEVHFFSESRNGASEYIPFDRPWPDVSPVSPAPGAVNISTTLNQLSFRLNHPLGQTMNYTVTSSPNIGSGSGTNAGNGIRTASISGLAPSTTYRWQVNATDQSGHKTSQNYWFITAPYITNSAPTQGTPILSGDSVQEDLSCFNQTTADINGDKVTSIYNWYKNGQSITNLNLPFDTKPNADAVYSGTAVTRDYSGRNNNGTVFGATWIPNGVVGGAFYFDGNDFITVNEQSNSLGGSGTWSQMSLEFWIRIPDAGSTERLIWKPDRYDTRSVNSYRVDVRNNNLSQIEFTWYICVGNNTYALNYNQISGIADWHHVACTYKSGNGLKIYLDGAQRAINSSLSIAGNVNATSGPLQIAFNGGRDFVGYLDEIRVYPTELTPSMVNQRFVETRNGLTNNSTIPKADLTVGGQWRCRVTPNDGQADGTTIDTSTVTIVSGPSVQYNLSIGIQGVGSTNPATGTYPYASGTIVQVSASAGSNYQFDHWLLNGTDYGTTNPCSITMNANYDLTAVFAAQNVTQRVFEDGFETGNFNAWNGTTTTTGGSANVVSNLRYSGIYSGQFNVTAGSGTRRAYCYKNINGLSEIYASARVYIADGLPINSDQALWLIQFVDSNGSVLASFGVRADASGTRLALQYANWPYTIGSTTLNEGEWYLLEAYFTHATSGETLILRVNGVEVASLAQDTTVANNITSVRCGIVYYSSSSAVSVNIDDVTIDRNTVSPVVNYGLAIDVQGSGTTNPTVGTYQYSEGTIVNVSATPTIGWQFSGWLRNGTDYGSANPCAITMDANYSLTAMFTEIPPVQYQLHVQTSGSGTTNATGNNMHNAGTSVAIQASANAGWSFSHWLLNSTNVGTINPYTRIMNANYNLTAVFTENPVQTSAYLAVRGVDNSIYYRKYNTNNNSWDSWQLLPGSTKASPAACVFENQLHLVVLGIDGALWHGQVNLQTNQFSGWQMISGATPNTPTLATNGTILTLVAQGLDNAIYIRNYQNNAWDNWNAISSGLTGNTPTATYIGKNLHLAVKELDGTGMYDAIVSCNGLIIRNWNLLSGASPSAVTLASTQNKEYLLAQGLDNTIYYREYNTANDLWNTWSALPGLTCDTPAATATNNELQIVVRGIDLIPLWKGTINTTTNNFSGWTLMEGTTPSKPTLTS